MTRQGYRVIALAEAFPKLRALKALKAQREVLEENASFLGFLILQNKIKTETKFGFEIRNDTGENYGALKAPSLHG